MYVNGKNISFIDGSNSGVKLILRDIRMSTPLSKAEEYDFWCQMRQGSTHAREKFITANYRYIAMIALKYQYSGTPFEDLFMAGCLGITRAADLFDGSLGYRFITFATKYIECEVRKEAYGHLNHKSSTISLDAPINPDDSDSYTMIETLRSSQEVSPDWHIRYDDALCSLKSRLNNHGCQAFSDFLDDYLSMKKAGYTIKHFADKHKLTRQQVKCFIDMSRLQVFNAA